MKKVHIVSASFTSYIYGLATKIVKQASDAFLLYIFVMLVLGTL